MNNPLFVLQVTVEDWVRGYFGPLSTLVDSDLLGLSPLFLRTGDDEAKRAGNYVPDDVRSIQYRVTILVTCSNF